MAPWLALALALAGVMSALAALQELPGYKTQFEVLKAGDGRSAGDSLRAVINLSLERGLVPGCALLAHFLTRWCIWCCAAR